MAIEVVGGTSGVKADVDANNRMKVALDTGANPAQVGGVRAFQESDDGSISGTPLLRSVEADEDYRMRIAHEAIFDNETFNYTAQNTGKHIYRNTTMTMAWAANGLTTNATNTTTTTTGASFQTYAEFPLLGTAQLYCEMLGSFTAATTTNTIIDFGMFRPNTGNPYNAADGVHFRLTSAGLFGVINNNGTETTTSVFSFTHTINRKYQFIITLHERSVEFWIDGVLYAVLDTPVAQGQPVMSTSLPFALRHAIVGGAAGAAISFQLNDYVVSLGGPNIALTASVMGQRVYGSYQGLSGIAMGTLAQFANSANPTAAVPTNTTAALGTGLGGQFWETDTLAVTTDGIIMSYQLAAPSANLQGRRLVVRYIKIESFVQTALTGGGYNAVWSLAFGHTSVALNTTESANTKAPRRIALGNQSVASAAAALTLLQTVSLDLGDAPIFVNPGEFIAVVKKKVGTAPSAGVIAHTISFAYGWE
jgi:hypothetical protein